ncbi:MAG TPA: transposase, partial [Gemmataceae bacterium]|nr:transposase [Gemmataceae bacterium]
MVGDDTVSEHRGKRVYGKARHRDPVRSSRTCTAHRYGHKWVALCVLVHFPFANRPWALPVLVALYRSRQDNQQRGRRHRTPAQVMQQQLRVLLRWFPQRQFRFAGDAGYGSHEMAAFAHHSGGRLTLVSKFPAAANLYEPPPPYAGKGRPRVKGAKAVAPQEVVATSRRTHLNVAWYGGGRRDVAVVTGTGHGYKGGEGLVPVRWVFVHDETSTHRDEYLYSTDVTLTAAQVIEASTGRWNVETTFAELRAYLGVETTRGWCQRTVLRAEPCLFGLYSLVALWYAPLPAERQAQ